MRLLDKIAGSRAPLVLAQGRLDEDALEVTAASCYAAQVTGCPLRFVLGDDLTRACAELAFADGARLSGCLDLLRIPARRLWIEWSDEVHQRVIYETQPEVPYPSASTGRRVGVLLEGSEDGCRAVMRTFWADAADEASEATLSPLETHLDLRGGFDLAGGFACDSRRADAATRALLEHARFRFDDAWAAYYRVAAHSAALQHDVVHQSVAAVAGDAPLILAFLLLLTARGATRSIPVSRAAINRKRVAHGRAPLLDHIEVRASLEAVPTAEPPGLESLGRQSPRLHHVRGSAARGMIRSRTVCLSFARHQLH